jgi:mutator protein MutT
MRNVVNALLLRQGSVLLARRSPHRKAYPGLWSFPGGHVEAGETLEQALTREASEEVNVAPVIYSAVARIADPNTTSEPITYHMYAVREWRGEPSIINDEHTELRWFTFEEAKGLPDLALEDYRLLFNSLRLADI